MQHYFLMNCQQRFTAVPVSVLISKKSVEMWIDKWSMKKVYGDF